jgi:hypothetical protein
MNLIECGQYYTFHQQNIIFQAVEHKGRLVLKDLRSSYEWNTPETVGEYFEGYVVKGQVLEPIMFYVSNGRKGKCTEYRESVAISALLPCGCETVKIDMGEWVNAN